MKNYSSNNVLTVFIIDIYLSGSETHNCIELQKENKHNVTSISVCHFFRLKMCYSVDVFKAVYEVSGNFLVIIN